MTILTMLFTIISVFMSVFEYIYLSNKFKTFNCITLLSFNIKNNEISSMNQQNFKSKIILIFKDFIHELSKILEIDVRKIERLIPIPHNNGVSYKFIIQYDCEFVKNKMKDNIKINSFIRVTFSTFKILVQQIYTLMFALCAMFN